MQGFTCALQDWSLCFSQSCGSLLIKSYWPSRSDSLGIPSPFVRSPGWEAWHGVQNLHNSGRTSLVLFFYSLCVTYLVGMGFDFIMIVPIPSSLSLDMVYLFSLAAAAAASLQSCPTLWDPIDSSSPGSPVPRILQTRILEWVAISFFNAWKWSRSVKSDS